MFEQKFATQQQIETRSMAALSESRVLVKEIAYRFDGVKSNDFIMLKWRAQRALFKTTPQSTIDRDLVSINEADAADVIASKMQQFYALAELLKGQAETLAIALDDTRDPRKLWDKLVEMYGGTSPAEKAEVIRQLQSFTWDSAGGSVEGLRNYVLKHKQRLSMMPGVTLPDYVISGRMFHVLPSHFNSVIDRLTAAGIEAKSVEEVLQAIAIFDKTRPYADTVTAETRVFSARGRGRTSSGRGARSRGRGRSGYHNDRSGAARQQRSTACYNCGSEQHRRIDCPRDTRVCDTCHKRGHLARYCSDATHLDQYLHKLQASSVHEAPRATRGRRQELSYMSLMAVSVEDNGTAAAMNVTMSGPRQSSEFLVDSGADCHLTSEGQWLINLRPVTGMTVIVADGSAHTVSALGDIPMSCENADGYSMNVCLRDVRHVPTLSSHTTLVSTGALNEQGHAVKLAGDQSCILTASGQELSLIHI